MPEPVLDAGYTPDQQWTKPREKTENKKNPAILVGEMAINN